MSDENQLQSDFSTIAALIEQVIQHSKGDVIAYLKVLRFLEHIHQDIRESYFQPTLPTDRHGLHNLLKEMETEGGWPYIPKMNLKAILAQAERAPQPVEAELD